MGKGDERERERSEGERQGAGSVWGGEGDSGGKGERLCSLLFFCQVFLREWGEFAFRDDGVMHEARVFMQKERERGFGFCLLFGASDAQCCVVCMGVSLFFCSFF